MIPTNELDLTVYHLPEHVGLENVSRFCTSSHRYTTRNRELICIICRNNGENEARSRKRGRERNEPTTTWKQAEERLLVLGARGKDSSIEVCEILDE